MANSDGNYLIRTILELHRYYNYGLEYNFSQVPVILLAR
jgi:hypothetical protein